MLKEPYRNDFRLVIGMRREQLFPMRHVGNVQNLGRVAIRRHPELAWRKSGHGVLLADGKDDSLRVFEMVLREAVSLDKVVFCERRHAVLVFAVRHKLRRDRIDWREERVGGSSRDYKRDKGT